VVELDETGPADLSREEVKSLTHGEFWIPERERSIYQEALRVLNAAGVPYVVSGLYAIYEYTGIYRKTKDLDLFFEPRTVVGAARVLRDAGFRVQLEQAHWLAKATKEGVLVDLIYGMGNGLEFIDEDWYRHSRPGILAAVPVRIAPAEELLWHRLFVSERHRWDMADIVHLVVTCGDQLDWGRILRRAGDHWRLLAAQVHLFDYCYPGQRRRIPAWVREELFERAFEEPETEDAGRVCQGTLISRFSFAIDVNEWGFRDPRAESVARARSAATIREIERNDVWAERSEPGGWPESDGGAGRSDRADA
jgi:hypothetical protein